MEPQNEEKLLALMAEQGLDISGGAKA